MDITFDLTDKKLTVKMIGELDESTATDARRKLDTILSDYPYKAVTFDMRNLSFMDSTGIGVMIGRYKLLKSRNVTAGICNTSPTVDKIFKMSGLYEIFNKIS